MRSNMAIHPGEVLKEEFLDPNRLSANRLAIGVGVPTNRITQIINGQRGITGETALLLGHAFGTTPEFWLNIQSQYELDLARRQVRKAAIDRAIGFAREHCLLSLRRWSD